MEEVSNPGLGPRSIAVYLVDKRSSYIVVAQLSPEFTARLVDRWQELEAQAARVKPAELSRMQILQLAMDAERGRLEAVAELAETTAVLSVAAPKAEAFEKLADARGSKTFREVAKFLEIKEPALRAFLSAIEMLYLLNGDWVPYAAHIDAGRLVLKTGKTDSGYMFTQTRFTAKGVTWIAEQWIKARGRVEA
jgi:phage antirepressor YoqD-like protein